MVRRRGPRLTLAALLQDCTLRDLSVAVSPQ